MLSFSNEVDPFHFSATHITCIFQHLIVIIIFRLGVTQGRSKCLTFPNGLEICRTLLFHVTEALTPKTLRSYRNNVLTAIPCILLPFVLAFELRRTGLPTVLVKTLSIGILHKLLKLPGDVGLHLRIFILESSSSEDSSVSLLLAFSAMLLLLPILLILVNLNS